MSMTLVNLNLIQKDMAKSLKQVATDKMVARDTAYYQANIGKITSVKEFLANDRLYQYAMKSFGMEDMIYAKGFMRKVLESDLTDDNSFANKLTDDRYRKFALAFNFSNNITVAQSDAQEDDIIGLYKQSITNEGDQVADDTRYYKVMIGSVQNVDQLLTNERLRNYVLKSFGQDTDYYSFSHYKAVLTSDVNDPASYVNALAPPANATPEQAAAFNTKKATWIEMAKAFNFNTDGTTKAGGAQLQAQVDKLTENYVLTVPSHKTPSAAAANRLYYDTQIKTITNVSQITSDPRMWEIVRTALDLDPLFLKSTFENIVTSDLNNPSSYVNLEKSETKKALYTGIAKLFNFGTDGTVAAGNAQTATQENTLLSGYNTHYDDTDEKTREAVITSYRNNIDTVKKVSDLLNSTTLMMVTRAAFGIKAGEFTNAQLQQALTSDLSDPKSYVNRLGDKRLIALAQEFNFDAKGNIAAPKMAQSQSTITETAKNYIIQQTRFLKSPELDTVKKKANEEADYYQAEVAKLKTRDQLLANRRLVDFNLKALGVDPATVSNDTLKKLFTSDLADPKSFVNTQTDKRLKQLVSSFNFDVKGNLLQNNTAGIQDRGHLQITMDGYVQQELEVREGEENQGVRLALYFQRKAQSITSAYDFLGDTALLEVFKTMYQLPDQFSSQNIEKQKAMVEKKMNLADLKDPEKVKKMIERFAIMYDMKNDEAEMNAMMSSSSGGISANTLATLAQLRYNR
jgi:hypothetical protein